MLNKRAYSYLLIILALALVLRIYFSFQSGYFSSDEAYFNIRHTQYILDNGMPMTYDELSYSGRQIQYPPLFHYLLAIFSLIFPIAVVAKILPAIFAVAASFVIYLISYEITKDNIAALFSALFSSFIPIFFQRTLNSASVYSLAILMFFLMIYCLIKLREERAYLVYFVFLSILLPLTHPVSFLFLLSLFIYSLTLVSENLIIRRPLKEAIIFSMLSILFIQFLIFRKSFLTNGPSILWQNIPQYVLDVQLSKFSLTQSIYSIGILSAILGSIAILFIIFTSRKDSHILLVSVVLSTLASILVRLISLEDGLLFLSLTLALLSSIAISKLLSYLDITKIASKKNYVVYSIILLSLLLFVVPSIFTARDTMALVPEKIDIEALEWIGNNLEGDLVIAAMPEEGNLVSYYTGKKNVADEYYVLAPDPESRLQSLESLYKTGSEFEALDIAQNYNIDIIFISEKAKSKYGIEDLPYLPGVRRCFDRRKYDDFAKIYQVRKC